MTSDQFWTVLKSRGLNFFSGVPDSTFTDAYTQLIQDPEIRYIPAVREDSALGLASAAYFSGGIGGVMLQNSGLGNLVNPLTSFSLMYRIPALLIVGWRGYGGPPHDAPEHWIMGAKTPQLLDTLEIPYTVLEPDQPPEQFEATLDQLLATMRQEATPGALLVRPGAIGDA
jgi:phosphonopyruvate decarboxylase